MLLKQLKYDFIFSWRMFVGMGVTLLGMGLYFLLMDITGFNTSALMPATAIGGVQFMYHVMQVAIIFCLVQLLYMYNRHYFYEYGYLMLTLPVGRGVLLASKYLIALFWSAYTILVMTFSTFLSTANRDGTYFGFYNSDRTVLTGIGLVGLLSNFIFAGFAGIAMLYLAVTLIHSTSFGQRVHKVFIIVTGLVAIMGIYFIGYNIVFRARERVEVVTGYIIQSGEMIVTNLMIQRLPIIGAEVGRIPLGDYFIDIYFLAAMLAFGLLASGLTYWLLRKKISLN